MDTHAKQTLIYVVRHGETEWNRIGRQQGHLDSPLTGRGTQQARALAEGLAGRGIESIYSSDLGRAANTASIISARLKLPVVADAGLRERHLGSLQGLTKAEWRDKYPAEWTTFESGDPDYQFPGGESSRERYERTVRCVEKLALKEVGHTILIVGHGGVLDGLFRRALDIPLSARRTFSLFNAAINSFTICKEFWRLDSWGETSHLGGLETLDDN